MAAAIGVADLSESIATAYTSTIDKYVQFLKSEYRIWFSVYFFRKCR